LLFEILKKESTLRIDSFVRIPQGGKKLFVVTSQIHAESFLDFESKGFNRGKNDIIIYMRPKNKKIEELRYGTLQNVAIFNFTNPVSVREIISAIESCGFKPQQGKEWAKIFPNA